MFDENFMKDLSRTAKAENFSKYRCFHRSFNTDTTTVVFYDENDNFISEIYCSTETLIFFGVI